MPVGMQKIGLVFFFRWYAMFIYWQFVTLSMGRTGLVNGSYNLVTAIAALLLINAAQKFGAKRVHAAALLLAGASLVGLAHISNKFMVFVPMIGLGIAWASMLGVPYVMVVSMVPKNAPAFTWES
jgi:maltose/moltooligosaccharide transporter